LCGIFVYVGEKLYTTDMSIITGRVVRGDGYGKVLGFPTANLDRRQFVRLRPRPKLGIYAGYAFVGEKRYTAAIVIGPKDRKGIPKVEAHLLSFKRNLYGESIALELVSHIRPFQPYTTEQALIAQIKKDIAEVKRIIKQNQV
jgi:FAD synthase